MGNGLDHVSFGLIAFEGVWIRSVKGMLRAVSNIALPIS